MLQAKQCLTLSNTSNGGSATENSRHTTKGDECGDDENRFTLWKQIDSQQGAFALYLPHRLENLVSWSSSSLSSSLSDSMHTKLFASVNLFKVLETRAIKTIKCCTRRWVKWCLSLSYLNALLGQSSAALLLYSSEEFICPKSSTSRTEVGTVWKKGKVLGKLGAVPHKTLRREALMEVKLVANALFKMYNKNARCRIYR